MRGLVAVLILDASQARDAPKLNASLGPLSELGKNIVGHKSNLGGPTDKTVFFRAELGRDKCKYGGPVWRGYGNPAFTGLKAGIVDQTESKLIEVKL